MQYSTDYTKNDDIIFNSIDLFASVKNPKGYLKEDAVY